MKAASSFVLVSRKVAVRAIHLMPLDMPARGIRAVRAYSFLMTLAFLSGPALCGAEGDPAALALGRHLADECSSCHRQGSASAAIPAISGRPAEEIAGLLEDYRSGRRTNPAMASVAQSLNDAEIEALAGYLATLPSN
jgi:cytochrome c553